MKRSDPGLTWGAAALLAVAVAAGCARDASAPEVGGPPAVPAARLTEGALVRTTVRDAITLRRLDGTPAVRELEPAAVEAVVTNGAAVDRGTGAVLAAARRDGDDRDLRYRDDGGHVHRLVVAGLRGRGPVASVRYERDGEVLAEVAYRWEAREGGYVLRERVLSLLRDGRVLLQQVRSAAAVEVTPAAAPGAAAAPDDAAGRPPVLRAEMAEIRCLKEWAIYIGASAALIVAGELYVVAPGPATASALVAAAGAWETSLNNLLVCQANSVMVL
jgi:hypothetical protein